MQLLKERILKDGYVLSDRVLKVDGFINHQVDPILMDEIGKTFADYFKQKGITKVFAIESSGIIPAYTTALHLGVPVVILKKQKSKILNGQVYQTRISSFTKGTSFELTLSKEYISKEDRIVLIDDFLANGETAMGAVRLIDMAGAKLEGVGILIEKTFQRGRQRLLDKGCDIYSLVRVEDLKDDKIELLEE